MLGVRVVLAGMQIALELAETLAEADVVRVIERLVRKNQQQMLEPGVVYLLERVVGSGRRRSMPATSAPRALESLRIRRVMAGYRVLSV